MDLVKEAMKKVGGRVEEGKDKRKMELKKKKKKKSAGIKLDGAAKIKGQLWTFGPVPLCCFLFIYVTPFVLLPVILLLQTCNQIKSVYVQAGITTSHAGNRCSKTSGLTLHIKSR